MIELKNVRMAYGNKLVLDNLSLSFPDRGMFAILGPSGRGKTTLLRLIAGLETPQSGSITVSQDVRISFCFQEDRLLPFKTVLQNILLVCPDMKKAMYWIEKVGLFGEENSYPSSLSGGMKRRAALARALAYDASILLMDEPFRALDDATHAQMLSLVCEAAKDKLLLLVTHDEEDTLGMHIIRL